MIHMVTIIYVMQREESHAGSTSGVQHDCAKALDPKVIIGLCL